MRRPITALLAGLSLLAGGMAGCKGKQESPETAPQAAATAESRQAVLIFAAASTTNAIDEIKVLFQQQSGINVRVSYAASSTLAQQIVQGADADIFLSADIQWADFVAGRGMEVRRSNLLGNRLVIIVPADSLLKIQSPADLAADSVTHLAVGDPAAVPIGKYAKQALQKLGLWDKLKGKVVAGSDVRHALAFVETGAAEAGIVYVTDAAISKKVKVAYTIAEDLTGSVRYPLVLLKHAQGNDAAESFYRYLRSPEAARVFEKHDFVVLGDDPHGIP